MQATDSIRGGTDTRAIPPCPTRLIPDRPADEDAFWLLLLHCLLDKRKVAPHYRSALRKLAPTSRNSPLAGAVSAAAGGGFDAGALIALVRAARWQALAEAGSALMAGIRRRTPVARRRINDRAQSARCVCPALRTPQTRASVICER